MLHVFASFSPLELLRQMRPNLLRAWLRPLRRKLATAGIALSGPRNKPLAQEHYEALARLFESAAPLLPPAYSQALERFEALASSQAMDALLAAARQANLKCSWEGLWTPLDAVVRLWLRAPALVERVWLLWELERPRSFVYYQGRGGARPAFSGPSLEQLGRLEERLDLFYAAWGRGPGARVLVQPWGGEWWFRLQHGAVPQRGDGSPRRPAPTGQIQKRCWDVLVYNPERVELRAHACNASERTVLARLFGQCLFESSDFFELAGHKFNLAPLCVRGRDCLACADVPELEEVRLKEVELEFCDMPVCRHRVRADDVFELVEKQRLRWPVNLEQITQATFEVQWRRLPKPRRVTLVPPSEVLVACDADSLALEAWWQRRGFASL